VEAAVQRRRGRVVRRRLLLAARIRLVSRRRQVSQVAQAALAAAMVRRVVTETPLRVVVALSNQLPARVAAAVGSRQAEAMIRVAMAEQLRTSMTLPSQLVRVVRAALVREAMERLVATRPRLAVVALVAVVVARRAAGVLAALVVREAPTVVVLAAALDPTMAPTRAQVVWAPLVTSESCHSDEKGCCWSRFPWHRLWHRYRYSFQDHVKITLRDSMFACARDL
jgi:hypothetical protein